jgi:hypothetical protein
LILIFPPTNHIQRNFFTRSQDEHGQIWSIKNELHKCNGFWSELENFSRTAIFREYHGGNAVFLFNYYFGAHMTIRVDRFFVSRICEPISNHTIAIMAKLSFRRHLSKHKCIEMSERKSGFDAYMGKNNQPKLQFF